MSNPIIKFGFVGAGKAAMEKLRTEVLSRVLLRRTKVERAADVKLPSLTVNIRKDSLSSQEMDFYTAMYTQGVRPSMASEMVCERPDAVRHLCGKRNGAA